MATVKVKRGKKAVERYVNGMIDLSFNPDEDEFTVEAGEVPYLIRDCGMEIVREKVLTEGQYKSNKELDTPIEVDYSNKKKKKSKKSKKED